MFFRPHPPAQRATPFVPKGVSNPSESAKPQSGCRRNAQHGLRMAFESRIARDQARARIQRAIQRALEQHGMRLREIARIAFGKGADASAHGDQLRAIAAAQQCGMFVRMQQHQRLQDEFDVE